tara:strand:+ start:2286 stop:3323 length:1038 start_codon:yes stop_codon:yes gene_type:complete
MNSNENYFVKSKNFKNYLREIYILKPTSYLINMLSYPWKGAGAVLMYHRVLPDTQMADDLDIGMAVSSSNFEKQIKTLKSKYKIVSMEDFNNNLKERKKEFMITITFDDGYKDNLDYALPILEKFQVPATVYVTTRFLEGDTWMWWYELKEEIKNKSKLDFNFKNTKYNFVIENQKQKNQAFKKLRELFLDLIKEKQIELLEIITKKKDRKNYSKICLSKEELKNLSKHPLITVGAHSHNHLNLKILERENLIYEIKESKVVLENLLESKIKHFSYPYGQGRQVSQREQKAVAELDFDTAVTTQVYPIKGYSPFFLPRIYVGNNLCEKSLINHLSGFYNLVSKIF